ncbi:aryl-alcohol dehydrogenase-like predicted oxidoreductase [Tamaricihabitans halophyticus]|uniref:Aryl-alcohol dehydrogenase-like predicted oxidoreductase n=1 Tax=Tamaricihabitans halophyticus TaxID=1262583 RepID=A0A4R2QN52_9PSEU|nr:aldo/keto reductase [Tamaricihabitans halophyticus]TCP50990.1 aryl-alcohol dehydrogenase-like predicted oxidoreductase [Tamaricihabitans halophyticus]
MHIEPMARPARTHLIGGELNVNRLGFGAMRLTGWRRPADPAPSIAVARRAVELGVNFIDTADSYALGANEELLAEALYPYPADLVIATKAGQSRPSEPEWRPLGRPEYLKQQAELSLRRLRVERIDLFQLHRIDPLVPLADQLGALAELRDAGKIRHIGLSEVSLAQLDEARTIVEIASVQNLYNVSDRRHEEVLDRCAETGIAFVPWLPIARGEHARDTGPLGEVASELGVTPARVALAWLLYRSPVMVPIPGTSSAAHLEDNVAAAELELTAAQYARLA